MAWERRQREVAVLRGVLFGDFEAQVLPANPARILEGHGTDAACTLPGFAATLFCMARAQWRSGKMRCS
jgi:hypothetical protein